MHAKYGCRAWVDEDDEEDEGEEETIWDWPKTRVCTALRKEITIDAMLIYIKKQSDIEKYHFEGPGFTKLRPNGRKVLFKFLELRRVTRMTNQLHARLHGDQADQGIRPPLDDQAHGIGSVMR